FSEPAARRSTGRRAHSFCVLATASSHHLATDHPGFDSHVVPLGGLAAMGGAAADYGNASPNRSGMACSHRKAPLGSGIRSGDISSDVYSYSHCECGLDASTAPGTGQGETGYWLAPVNHRSGTCRAVNRRQGAMSFPPMVLRRQ